MRSKSPLNGLTVETTHTHTKRKKFNIEGICPISFDVTSDYIIKTYADLPKLEETEPHTSLGYGEGIQEQQELYLVNRFIGLPIECNASDSKELAELRQKYKCPTRQEHENADESKKTIKGNPPYRTIENSDYWGIITESSDIITTIPEDVLHLCINIYNQIKQATQSRGVRSNICALNEKKSRSRRNGADNFGRVLCIVLLSIGVMALVGLCILDIFVDVEWLIQVEVALNFIDPVLGMVFFVYEILSDNQIKTNENVSVENVKVSSKSRKNGGGVLCGFALLLSVLTLIASLFCLCCRYMGSISGISQNLVNTLSSHFVWTVMFVPVIVALICAILACSRFFSRGERRVKSWSIVATSLLVAAAIFQCFNQPVIIRAIEYKSNNQGAYTAYVAPTEDYFDYIIPLEYKGAPVIEVKRNNPTDKLWIKHLDLGGNVEAIGDEAFAHNSGLTRLDIPENVTHIGRRAFYDSKDLSEVIIRGELVQVDATAFGNCPNITTVWWNIANSQVKFGEIFAECDRVSTVILHINAQVICDEMFDNCKSIERVVIRENVTNIGENAFRNCDNLKQVFFGGNEVQWQRLVETMGDGNQALKSATLYYYSLNEPQHNENETGFVGGNYWHFSDGNDCETPVEWVFKAPEYKVTFFAGGELFQNGMSTVEVTYKHGQTTIEAPSIPNKRGYVGAWEEYVLDNSDLVVNAVYTPKTYLLNFNYNGADGGIGENFKTVTFGQPIGELPHPSKTNLLFKGWYIEHLRIDEEVIWDLSDDDAYMAIAEFFIEGNTKDYFGGLGTIESPYLISTKQHFENIAKNSQSSFEILNDIDLGIWNAPFDFTGHMDGKNHKITYTQKISPDESSYWGLFSTVANVSVSNLYIEFTISAEKSGNYYVGGLAGFTRGQNNIARVCTSGEMTFKNGSGDCSVGGLFGKFTGGTIEQCCNTANLENHAEKSRVGGLVGQCMAEATSITISNCYNTGNIRACTAYIFGGRSAGGLLGQVKGQDAFKLNVSNCYNDSEVKIIQDKNAAMGWWGCGGIFGDISGNVSSNIRLERTFWNKQKGKLAGNNKSFHNDNGVDSITGTIQGWSTDIWQFYSDHAPQLKWTGI